MASTSWYSSARCLDEQHFEAGFLEAGSKLGTGALPSLQLARQAGPVPLSSSSVAVSPPEARSPQTLFSSEKGGQRNGRQVCWQFRDCGSCSRDSDCRFLHVSGNTSASSTAVASAASTIPASPMLKRESSFGNSCSQQASSESDVLDVDWICVHSAVCAVALQVSATCAIGSTAKFGKDPTVVGIARSTQGSAEARPKRRISALDALESQPSALSLVCLAQGGDAAGTGRCSGTPNVKVKLHNPSRPASAFAFGSSRFTREELVSLKQASLEEDEGLSQNLRSGPGQSAGASGGGCEAHYCLRGGH